MSLKYRKLPQTLNLHSHINTSAIIYTHRQLWTTLHTHAHTWAHTPSARLWRSGWTWTCYNVRVMLQHLWIYNSALYRPEPTATEEEPKRGRWWAKTPKSPEGEKTWSTWLVLKENTENCLLALTGHRAPPTSLCPLLTSPAGRPHHDHSSASFRHRPDLG